MFDHLDDIKDSLRMDQLLQSSLAYLMKPKHYQIAIKSGFFFNRILIRMMVYYVGKSTRYTDEVSYAHLLFILLTIRRLWKLKYN